MGKKFDSLLTAIQNVVNDAMCNEADYRAEAKATGNKMADILADHLNDVIDIELDESEDEDGSAGDVWFIRDAEPLATRSTF